MNKNVVVKELVKIARRLVATEKHDMAIVESILGDDVKKFMILCSSVNFRLMPDEIVELLNGSKNSVLTTHKYSGMNGKEIFIEFTKSNAKNLAKGFVDGIDINYPFAPSAYCEEYGLLPDEFAEALPKDELLNEWVNVLYNGRERFSKNIYTKAAAYLKGINPFNWRDNESGLGFVELISGKMKWDVLLKTIGANKLKGMHEKANKEKQIEFEENYPEVLKL